MASRTVENAGDIVAYGNLSVKAQSVTGLAMFAPDFANRPAGFYNLFTGAKALAFFSPIGGNFLAPAGIVSIQSETPLVLAGGTANGQVATESRPASCKARPAIRISRADSTTLAFCGLGCNELIGDA